MRLTGRTNRCRLYLSLEPENERLRGVEKDYGRLRRHLGGERADEMIASAKEQEAQEIVERKPQLMRDH
jgi:hypothetical protein